MEILAKRLKKLREEKKKEDSKFTQAYVAKLIGVARVTYTAYENGTKQPPMETINILADIFNVSADYLLGRTDSEYTENFDPLSEINKMLKEYGIEGFGMFDINEWKNLSKEDVLELKKHFEWVAHKAKERNEEDTEK